MAGNVEQAWREVGERFSSWGHQVAVRYRDAGTATVTSAEDTERELRRVAKQVMDELSKGFTAVGKTVRDDQAREDLGAAFTALGEAITATVNDASRAIRSGSASGSTPPSGSSTAGHGSIHRS